MSNRSSLSIPPRSDGAGGNNGNGSATGRGLDGEQAQDTMHGLGGSSNSSVSSVASSYKEGTADGVNAPLKAGRQADAKGLGVSAAGASAGNVSNGSVSGSDGQVWVGAFERIMGDQDELYQAKARNKTFSRSPDPSQGLATGTSSSASGFESASTSVATSVDGSASAAGALPVIRISPSSIDFGTANVGARKSANVTIQNISDVTAHIEFRFVSKVLSLDQDELEIPPKGSANVRIDFFPRRVNEAYRKQVTIANMLNRDNDQILEVRSENVDEQKIGFHSLFYRILTSTGSNYVDFGDVNINCTRLRSFGIENVSKGPLSIELTPAQPEDLKLYVKAVQASEPEAAKPSGPATKYAGDDEALKADTAEAEPQTQQQKASKAKVTAHLKESFLEAMSQESPANVRSENTSWRTAQKQRHVNKGVVKGDKADKRSNATASGASNASSAEQTTKKPNINMVAALKKGGKGRLTVKHGKSITFKDRTLLRDFEHLDLASGLPVDDHRISVKSKMYQQLGAQETGKDKSSKDKAASKDRNADANAKKGAGASATQAPTPSAEETANKGSDASVQRPSQPDSAKKGSVRPLPALTGRRKLAPMLYDALDVSKLSLDELVAAVEALDSSLGTVFLGNSRAEEQLVRTEVNLQRELASAISEGRLIPVENLTLQPGEDRQILAIYTPNGSTRPHIMGNARKQDSRIFIRIVDFSTQGVPLTPDLQSILQLDKDELPVRELMVKSNLCRSLMDLSQPHINFGQMQKGETKERKIVIQNRSEWALRYCIRKSGMVASGDIKIKNADRYGVVPGHGKREVQFVFCPSLTGSFQERLVIENVADRDKDEVVLIKANVARVPNFSVEPKTISFPSEEERRAADGDTSPVDESNGQGSLVRLGQVTPQPCSFVVSNISTKPRTLVLHIDNEDLSFGSILVDALVSLSCQEGDTRPTLSKAEEEEVETISQKLKIANRKGQADKIRKYTDRLSELGLQVPAPPAAGASSEKTDPVEEGSLVSSPKSKMDEEELVAAGLRDEQQSPDAEAEQIDSISTTLGSRATPATASTLRRGASAVTLVIAPQQSKRLLVRLRPRLRGSSDTASHSKPHLPLDISIPLQVHEFKNIDEVQTVDVLARIFPMVAEGPSDAASDIARGRRLSVESLLEEHQKSATEEGMVLFSPSGATQPATPQNPLMKDEAVAEQKSAQS